MYFLTQQTSTMGSSGMIFMLVGMFALMYFMTIRPQKKRQNEVRDFRNGLSVGQNVVTAGGIYGVVKQINEADNTLMIEVASGVRIKVDRNSVYAQAQPTQV